MNAERCPVVILAAGASMRLGRPKQLLQFQQQSLIRRLVSEAQKSTATVVVVTGSNHHQLVAELQHQPIVVVENRDWAQGMGSSISTGMGKIKSCRCG